MHGLPPPHPVSDRSLFGSAALGRVVRAIDLASLAGGVLSTLFLVAACLVVCHMVFVRFVLGWSSVWQTEFVIYATVASIFLGAPYVLEQKGHIGVDLIQQGLRGGSRIALDLLSGVLSLVFCAVLAWSGWHYFHEALVEGWKTETVWAIPLWIPLTPIPLGFGLLCLQYLAEFAKLLDAGRRAAGGEAPLASATPSPLVDDTPITGGH